MLTSEASHTDALCCTLSLEIHRTVPGKGQDRLKALQSRQAPVGSCVGCVGAWRLWQPRQQENSPAPGLWGELRTGEAGQQAGFISDPKCVPDLNQMVLETGEGELLGWEGQGS